MIDNYSGLSYDSFEVIENDIYGNWYNKLQMYDKFRDFNPFNAKRSAGLGIRIFMPAFGLLGIDFGYGFDSQYEGDLNAHGWETHFVIGQNF